MKTHIIVSLILGIMLIASISSLVLTSALTIGDVSVSPSEVSPGQKFTIIVNLENNLDDKVIDVDVSLDLTKVSLSPEKTSEVFFDEIKEDKGKTAEFNLIVDSDATAGNYKIPLTVTYKYNESIKTKSTLVSVIVNAKPNLDLSINSVLMQNQKNNFQIQISNNGLGKASFLEVELGAGNYNLLSGNKVYIGDLDSNDFNTASFSVFLKDSSSVSFPITIRYKDPLNTDYENTVTLTGRAYSQQEAISLGLVQQSNTGLYVGIVIAVIVIYIVYSRVRKWMKKRKQNNQNGR